jgi:hypothetical protein
MVYCSFIFGFGSGIIYSFGSIFNGACQGGRTKKASKQNKIINTAVNA